MGIHGVYSPTVTLAGLLNYYILSSNYFVMNNKKFLGHPLSSCTMTGSPWRKNSQEFTVIHRCGVFSYFSDRIVVVDLKIGNLNSSESIAIWRRTGFIFFHICAVQQGKSLFHVCC